MRKFPSNDFAVAMRHGHLFKIALTQADGIVSFTTLKTTFQEILSGTLEDAPPVAGLRADRRDSWTDVRSPSLPLL